MQRAEFLLNAIAVALYPSMPQGPSIPQDDKIDPSQGTQSQALRVLLGSGTAQAIDGKTFTYDGRTYRGSFAVQDGHVINTVSLEEYLYSVVPREMPPSWNPAALQAQAIVARTFVLQRSNPNRDYDLIPSEADQVYTGVDSEHPQSTQAVDASAGQALRFQDGFALALYSSCCGGHTEASSDAWGGRPVSYLGGVACTYCSPAPWYSWKQSVALDRLQNALAAVLPPDTQIDGLSLADADGSGRARFWVVESGGVQTRVPAAKVRSALGGRVLPSLRVKKVDLSTQAPRTVTIEGAGLGHGVGLCQWGARGMAQKGASTQDILSFYYPGTGIGND
ncbi:MAG TPA: SpoIID/LytB domain-containing protein [Candidatus Baltobacteraceae bacterium]|nr:SpoIID/LytB domain-containing protein [Candidatus Baltobacteraceae bacterium]